MAVAEKPLYYLSIHEAQQLIQKRQLSPVELTRAVLDRIQAVDKKLHAYINLMADNAMEESRTAETENSAGSLAWSDARHSCCRERSIGRRRGTGANSPIYYRCR